MTLMNKTTGKFTVEDQKTYDIFQKERKDKVNVFRVERKVGQKGKNMYKPESSN